VISRNYIKSTFPTKRLDEVVEFLDSKRRPVTESDRRAGPYPYYGANGIQGMIDGFIFDEPLVLLAEDGGHFKEPSRGIAYRISGKTWVNNHAHVLRPTPAIELGYLCRVLENYNVTPFVSGTTRGKLTKAGASKIEIPLPPLPEQKRIADILDHADALRAKRHAALAELDTLSQSLFLDMFGDPASNTSGWDRISLIHACDSKDDIKCGPFGTQLGRHEFRNDGVPLWGIKHVNRFFKLPTHEFLDQATADRLSQYSIENGDIVMTRKGTVGNCAVYPETLPKGIMHSDLLRIRVDQDRCDPVFLSHQLHHSRDVETQLALISGGAIMAGVNVTKLKELEVLLPPVPLQREFAQRITAAEELKTAHRNSLAELDSLFASLQHRVFLGEL
jgi:type I restriction enzyme, S subunit